MEAMPASVEGRGPTLAEDPALGLSHRAEDGDPRRHPARPVPRRARPDHRRHRAAHDRHRAAGGNELYTWVVTIYLLTATITGVFYGKLSDLYGRQADAADRHHASSWSAPPSRASARAWSS